MACDAQSVETLVVATDKYYELSERQWLECLANLFAEIGVLSIGVPLEQKAVELAYSLGLPKLSDRALEQAILASFTATSYDAQSLTNEIAAQGYDKLSHAEIRKAIVAVMCSTAGGSAQTLETLAINTNGYLKLSEFDTDLAILAELCTNNSSFCTAPNVLRWRGKWTELSDRGLREVIAAIAQYAASPAPPVSITAVEQPDGSIIVTWPLPGPTVVTTEVWISTDGGVTYVLGCSAVAPATTCTVPSQGTGVSVCIKVRSCGAASCGAFTTPTCGVCAIITGGIGASDDFESYTNGAALNGLNGGTGFCNSTLTPYVDRTGYLGMLAQDDFESYVNGANLVLLNGGTGAWNGAYNADNVAVTTAADLWADGSVAVTIPSVESGGFPAYTYQWKRDGITLTNTGHYTGVTTATLTISGFDGTDIGFFTLTVTDSTLRSFTSAGCSAQMATTAGQLWAQQVNVNGGDWPAIAHVNAADTFNTSISGLASRIYHLNFIAPDNLVAALTPFIHTNGAALWTKHTRGTPPAESITVNGLKAGTDDTNGTVYDTGFAPSGVSAWTASNGGMSVYVSDVTPSSTSDTSGCYNGSNAAIGIQVNNTTARLIICWDVTQRIQFTATIANGFYMASRSSASLLTSYFANSGTAWASTGTNVVNTGRTPNPQNVGVCGEIQAGPVYAVNPERVSFVAYHDGFSTSDGQTLYNAVQALRTSFGGGFA